LPVAAKIALHTAGAIGEVPGSPADFLPIAVELLGEEHGQGSGYARSHFGLIGDQRDGFFRIHQGLNFLGK